MTQKNVLILFWMLGSTVAMIMLLIRRPSSERIEFWESFFPMITLALSWYVVVDLILEARSERRPPQKNNV